jgi:hypothetical protein
MIRDMGRVVEQESRIRQLCAEAAAAQGPEALRSIMEELKTLLHEQNEERKLLKIEYPIFLDDLRKRAA